GAALCQGVLAALVKKGISGKGSHIETSLLEALVDFQFEVLTTYLNDGRRLPKRSDFRSAHAYLSAPYGVYPAKVGWLAIATTPLGRLQDLRVIPESMAFSDNPASGFAERDAIKQIMSRKIEAGTIDEWLGVLEPADIWCARVLNWEE